MAISEALLSKVIALRHEFHQHPEVSAHEFETTKRITEILEHWGITVNQTSLVTGVVATIEGAHPGKQVTLRADIDALPITEATDLSFKSVNDGVMHACGHDIHLSSLLGAAYLLQQERDQLTGTIQLLFQPAEEAEHGAEKVLNAHVLDHTVAMAGFHNNPNLPVGTIGLKAGSLMAGCYHFDITLHGAGAHGARPEKSRDPIVAQAAVVTALQTVVSRNVKPLEAAVVSVTQVHGGDTWNVLPEEVTLGGTVRTFNDETTELVKRRMEQLVSQVAAAYDVTADFDWAIGAYPIQNDADLVSAIRPAVSEHAEVIVPEVSMAGEDFATFQQQIPGVFVFIGSNGAPDAADWHDPYFVGLDSTLKFGIQYFVDAAHALSEYAAKKAE
ncbi:amidohydrolase [Lactobacillus sp. LC28-10]|uniref:Amidohydrolase n=1 Tax=Secundilactobacillus angelensis TaxID=2722706 RepID=A0ABX1KU43_9LACO|nr:amidohydrolase [Secundilactobacillus angelensis]MCH5461959.1 amidohydrolase [Secundilactobacillus angelensis]NLR17447.1 amidohydrolase [Secundilactobacillus angelensis]